jgi:pimeloyl-ACP methyl ester carboxylesterase
VSIASAGAVSADAVYLKDGFTLHGKVRREADVIFDPATGQPIPVFKGNFFVVDDRVRWVIFEHRNVQDANPEVNIRRDFLELVRPLAPGSQVNRLPKQAKAVSATDFDDKWERVVKIIAPEGPYNIRQRITQLNGHNTKIESTSYPWNLNHFTQELGLDLLKKLLDNHPDTKEKPGDPPDIEKRMKRFRLLMQANYLLAADEELSRALKDIPAEKERIERSRTSLRQAQVQAVWDEAQSALKTGRYSVVRNILSRIPMTEVEPRLASEIAAMKSKLDGDDGKIEECRTLFKKLSDRLAGPLDPTLGEAIPTIEAALGPDMIGRLDAFLTMGNQHETEVAARKAPTQCIEDVLALAVTGFVMGNASAEPKAATADRVWRAREFALNYLRTHDAASRKSLLREYEAGPTLGFDEFAQMVLLLPPPEPELPSASGAEGVEERVTKLANARTPPIPYTLQLPPEYTANRKWPVLIVVPSGSGEPAKEAMIRWSQAAQQNGYILASPQFPEGSDYNYLSEDHLPVLELLRDLRQRYSVDSDRTFIGGYGEGGTIATDIALGHPDLFAGVVTLNARPRWSASMWYWLNAQYLPFYVIAGERAGDCCDRNRKLFQNWMNNGYPSLMTIYRGRPDEFYLFELPIAFDWMNRKRRAMGFPQLGRRPNAGTQGEEFQTARPGDNHFYWLEVLAHNPRNTTKAMGTGEMTYTPAGLVGHVRDNNVIAINARGIKSLRVWLGQMFDPQTGWRHMVDLTKPVTIQVNRFPAKTQQFTPSLEVMMEDLYERGDRQRLFWASVDFPNVQ